MKIAAIFLLMIGMVGATEWIDLWEGSAPGAARPPAGTEVENERQQILETEVPQYAVYKPEEPNGQSVVILPGGGYGLVSMDNEGYAVADWLNERGITAVIVKYRVSRKEELGYQYPVPLLDARRAIRTVRAKAKEWGVDPEKVGVMGFSAGGHLASMCTTMFEEKFEGESSDLIDAISCRPDFSILVYPVISMGLPHGHGGSQNRLLGKDVSPEKASKFNTSKQVAKNTPPCLLIHTADDKSVPIQNSLDFIAACHVHKVPVVAHLYEKGGHGFGLGRSGDAVTWPARMEEWLAGR